MKQLEIDMDLKLNFIHGFSNKTRMLILECLMTGEQTVTQIVNAVNVSQSSISQHLACLKGCGLITRRQEGKYVYYAIRSKQIYDLLEMFDKALLEVQDDVGHCENHIV